MKNAILVALAAVLALTMCAAVSADADPRFSPFSIVTGNNFAEVLSNINHVPASGTVTGIQTRTIETGEATHACRNGTPSAGTHSVWFSFNFPGGTFNLDTQGSNYNTVVSIYKPGGNFASLTPVACSDDDIPAIDLTSRISTVLAPGTYFVQVSRYETTPTGVSQTLSIALSAVFDGPAPKNDNFAQAKPISINQTVTIKNAQFSTEESAEPDRECGQPRPSQTVWFSLAVPDVMILQLSLDTGNSALDYGLISSTDTVLEVFSGASLASLTPELCSDDSVLTYGGLIGQYVPTNTMLYIRVSAFGGENMVGASTYKLRVTLGAISSLNADYSFEQIPQTVWTLKNASGDGQVCGLNLSMGNDCVMRFVGNPGEKSSIQQTFTLPSVLRLRKDHPVVFGIIYQAADPATKLSTTLKINYTDGTPSTTMKIKVLGSDGPGFLTRIISGSLASTKVGTLKLTVKNSSTNGTIDLDGVVTGIYGTLARDTAPAGVLPPPPAPGQAFRGFGS